MMFYLVELCLHALINTTNTIYLSVYSNTSMSWYAYIAPMKMPIKKNKLTQSTIIMNANLQ